MIVIISGCEVLIDDEDAHFLKEYKYFLHGLSYRTKGRAYFLRNTRIGERHSSSILHRDIMGCTHGDGKVVDHINGNTFDNRKQNLRVCTGAENARNRKIDKRNTSGHKGVFWNKDSKNWRAMIRIDRHLIHLGSFNDINDAIQAYAEASKKYHGEFGRLS